MVKHPRLDELDLLRGLSVIGMILVVTPGDWASVYPWLNHAEWEGVVAVDMIAPAFMFCIGFAIPLSLTNRISNGVPSCTISSHIIQRGVLLIILGLFIHWTEKFDFSTLRIPGVLQRIGLTYIFVSLVVLYIGRKSNNVFCPNLLLMSSITAAIILGSWMLFYFVPVPGGEARQFSSDGSWASYIDQNVFGIAHMLEWGQTNGVVTYDPDGLMCSLTTSASVFIGSILGVMYLKKSQHYTHTKLLTIAFGLIALGYAFSPVCPIVKKLYTGSFVLISSGASILALVLLWSIKDQPYASKLFHPLYAYGANALLAFVISWLGLFWFLDLPLFGYDSIRSIAFNNLTKITPSKTMASLTFGIIFISILYAGLAFMLKRQWYVRL